MSEIPLNFAGMLAMKTKDMLLADAIQEAVQGFNRLFKEPADICYVLQKDLKKAIDDDHENGQLAQICTEIQVQPIDRGLPGFHVWAGRVVEDLKAERREQAG